MTGNAERRKFIETNAIHFGGKFNEPVVKYTCKVRKGRVKRNVYGELPFDVSGVCDEIVRYLVRGAPCVLKETIETRPGLAKGTTGIILGAVSADGTDLDSLPRGPEYIIVRIGGRTIALRPDRQEFRCQDRQKSGPISTTRQNSYSRSHSIRRNA